MLAGGTALHVGSKFKNGSELMLGDVRSRMTVPIRPCFSWAENSPQNLAVIAICPNPESCSLPHKCCPARLV